jgi:ELWxxDGT repeat protein
MRNILLFLLVILNTCVYAQIELVKDINTNGVAGSSDPAESSSFLNAGNWSYFEAVNEEGRGLWKTDGTPGGTTLVKVMDNILLENSHLVLLADYMGKLLFSANDLLLGNELWISDGTGAGTFLLKDTNPGLPSGDPEGISIMDSALYFFAYGAVSGKELYRSDGTTAGTVLLKDINPGFGSSWYANSNVVINNHQLYFGANDNVHGVELWRSDGTAAGTQLVKDLAAGSSSSNPIGLDTVNSLVIFEATDTSSHLYVSDGSDTGTFLLQPLNRPLNFILTITTFTSGQKIV